MKLIKMRSVFEPFRLRYVPVSQCSFSVREKGGEYFVGAHYAETAQSLLNRNAIAIEFEKLLLTRDSEKAALEALEDFVGGEIARTNE